MDETNYRLTADFHTKHDASAVVDFLEATPELSKDGGALSYPGSKTLLLYAPTADVMERVARLLRVGADAAGVRPVSVATGQWLSDEARWSDDETGWDGSGVIEAILSSFPGWPT